MSFFLPRRKRKKPERPTSASLKEQSLAAIVANAWEIGRTFDLTGIGYGRPHSGDDPTPITEPFPYYHFLAGFTRLTHARHIIEIGTHHGGSARAMAAGFSDAKNSKIVTFDSKPDAQEMLRDEPTIRAYCGNANTTKALDFCRTELGG